MRLFCCFIAAMFSLSLFAALPAPTGFTFAKGAKFTVAGYTNANGTARAKLQNFPVLVRIAAGSPQGFSNSDVQHASAPDKNDIDIAFVDMSGNGLPFEIDTWDASGTSLVWVRLPTMTNGTEFVLCWGGGTSGKTVCDASPFSDYVGVWHMSEASGTVADSTGHNLDARPAGANASVTSVAVDGRIGNARQCATNVAATAASYLSIPNYDSSHSAGQNFTVSGWFNISSDQPNTGGIDVRFFSRKTAFDTPGGWEMIHKPSASSILVRGKTNANNIEKKNVTLRDRQKTGTISPSEITPKAPPAHLRSSAPSTSAASELVRSQQTGSWPTVRA